MALIFDLDDTLFDHPTAMRAFLRVEYELSDHAVEDVLAAACRGKASPEVLSNAIARVTGRDPATAWDDVQHKFGLHAELVAPGVLDEAAQRFVLGLLTNGGEVTQSTKIATLGLEQWIAPERLIISGVIGAWKPDPAAFAAVLDACGASAETSVYVGDDASHDIGGARAAGLKTCWVARDRAFPDTPQPDWTIASIEDLPSVWDEFPT